MLDDLLKDIIRPVRWAVLPILALAFYHGWVTLPNGKYLLFGTINITNRHLSVLFIILTAVQPISRVISIALVDLRRHLDGFYTCTYKYDFRSLMGAKKKVDNPTGWNVVEPKTEKDADYEKQLMAVLARWDQKCGKSGEGDKDGSFYKDIKTLQSPFQFTLRLKKHPGWQHYGVNSIGLIEDIQGSNHIICLVVANEFLSHNEIKMEGPRDFLHLLTKGLPVVLKFKQHFSVLGEEVEKETFYLHLKVRFDPFSGGFVLSPALAYLELEPNDTSQ